MKNVHCHKSFILHSASNSQQSFQNKNNEKESGMASVVSTATAPSPTAPAMPAHRVDAFRRAVAERTRLGAQANIAAPVVMETLLREQQALVLALKDPSFESALVQAFVQELAQQQPNPAYAISEQAARAQMLGILANRVRDAQGFCALLSTPEFVAQATAEAAQPAPAPKEYDLPAGKKEEIIRRLVQPQDVDGAEPPVHVAASALGHRMVHMALANIYRPKAGGLHKPLTDALARAWPEATDQQREQLATRWLKARHDPAHSIADGLKEGGELYEEAMRRAGVAKAPAATVTVPATAQAKVKETADLVMEL